VPLPGRSAWTLQLAVFHSRGPRTARGAGTHRAVQTPGAGDEKGKQGGTTVGRQKGV